MKANFVDGLVTDSLGFELKVVFEFGNFTEFSGQHKVLTDESLVVDPSCEHRIFISLSMDAGSAELAEIISHEVYHLFYSIRHLIKVDEETETEVFGQLVRHIFNAYAGVSE